MDGHLVMHLLTAHVVSHSPCLMLSPATWVGILQLGIMKLETSQQNCFQRYATVSPPNLISNPLKEKYSEELQDGARLDIAANGFWGGRFERAFFDVRVFNPHAPSNRQLSLPSTYQRHENQKKRVYEQRIRDVEHGSFVPLVMSVTGGLGRIATTVYKRLASMLSNKWNQPYSTTMCWLRCRLSFSLLRSSILAIRGARSSSGHFIKSQPVDLVSAESQVSSSLA